MVTGLIRLLFPLCLFFLISLTDASAFTHSWTEILSDNKSTTGWVLETDIGITGISGSPQWAYGHSGSVGEFTPMEFFPDWMPFYPGLYNSAYLNGQPSDYNGYTFAWSWSDSNASYIQTAVATGIRKVEMSYNFHVVTGGEHPTIGWSNDDLNIIDYRIRVLNPSTKALLYQTTLDYAYYGANPVYIINGFSFALGEDYLLRIEARQNIPLTTYSSPDVTIPSVLNRSTLYVSYINSGSNPSLEIVSNFAGIGIWGYDGSSWTQLTSSAPESIVYSGSTIYAEFGAGGIWRWNGTSWTMLTPSNPENMVASSGSTLFAEFGAGGIWRWNGTSWTQLTPSNPENMVVSGSTLYAEFGAGGIWRWDGTSWTMLTPSNPENMVASGSNLYADFGVGGIWMLDGTSWTMLTPSNPENMVASGSNLYADFGAGGIWRWNGTSWTMLTPSNPENMVASGPTLYADFGAGGIYMWNGSTWRGISGSNPENMMMSGPKLYADFGAGGLYMWDGTTWSWLTQANPIVMAAQN